MGELRNISNSSSLVNSEQSDSDTNSSFESLVSLATNNSGDNVILDQLNSNSSTDLGHYV